MHPKLQLNPDVIDGPKSEDLQKAGWTLLMAQKPSNCRMSCACHIILRAKHQLGIGGCVVADSAETIDEATVLVHVITPVARQRPLHQMDKSHITSLGIQRYEDDGWLYCFFAPLPRSVQQCRDCNTLTYTDNIHTVHE